MKKTKDCLPQGLRFDVFRRDEFTCRYCGRSSPQVVLHADHIKPRSKGGEDTMDNLVTACTDCNYGKRAKENVVPPPHTDGLVGLWGHEYVDGKPEHQFRIVRRVNPELYMIQFYSFVFGEAMNVESRQRDVLLGPTCKLYTDHAVWCEVMDRQIERDAERWRAERAN